VAMKLVIYGPPHSGKSVLVAVIRGLLPRHRFVIIEGAPDGEGITGWAHEADSVLVRQIRRKGRFTVEFVDWAVDSVRNSTADLTVVDVGGRPSPENERISRVCSHFLIVSSDPEKTLEWEEFGRRLGLEPVAILDSCLTGEDELYNKGQPLRGRITKLERDDPPFGSTTAQAVADRIMEVTGEPEEGLRPFDGSAQADVNFPLLAEKLGLPIRHGGPDRDWLPSILSKLLGVALARCAELREVKLWGNCSAGHPYHTLACAFKQRVRYYDPKVPGYVPLPEVRPQGESAQLLDWRIEERDDHTFVEFVIPGQIFDVFDLPLVTPPAVPQNKGMVISGKGPWWLTGTIARSYCRAGCMWVAVFTPQESGREIVGGRKWSELYPKQGPAVVIASRDERVPVGTVVPFQLLENNN